MNLKLKSETENSPVVASDAVVDQAMLSAMAMEMVRLDSSDCPADYLHETEAPFGGE